MNFKSWLETFDNRLPFWTTCESAPEWVIHFLTEHSEQVDWSEFKRMTQWEYEAQSLGYRVPNNRKVNKDGLWLHKDWSVSFHKVNPQVVNGQKIYYFDWSRIEHIFCTDEGQEALITKAKEAWMNDGNEED